MYEKMLVSDQMGSAKKFLEMTRPLMTADFNELAESLILLDLKTRQVNGSALEIMNLQKKEIINEIALRN